MTKEQWNALEVGDSICHEIRVFTSIQDTKYIVSYIICKVLKNKRKDSYFIVKSNYSNKYSYAYYSDNGFWKLKGEIDQCVKDINKK